ncbi:MAG: ATP-binding protein [Chloroflexota bacterium]|nr:ATP-binding protein [Chloroflexota bacterium]
MREHDSVQLDLPASHKYLNVLGACIAEMLTRVEGLAERDIVSYNIQLAVHEACTNIVEHAYAGRNDGRIKIALMLDEQPRRLVVDIHDTGGSFDITQAREPNLDDAQIHGYGLFLIRNLMDEMSYTPGPSNNRWHLVKHL